MAVMENESVNDKEAREHVEGVEKAASSGDLNRTMAERVIKAGHKALRSHNLERGLGRNFSGGSQFNPG